MAEDVRIIQDLPAGGSRRQLQLFRSTTNSFRVRFKNKLNQDVDVSGYSVNVAGKEHESDLAEAFDASGTPVPAVSGAVDFSFPISSGAPSFQVPGVAEFRFWVSGVPVSGTPSGRHRMPLLIFPEVGV